MQALHVLMAGSDSWSPGLRSPPVYMAQWMTVLFVDSFWGIGSVGKSQNPILIIKAPVF